MNRKHVIGYTATALVALGIGGAAGGGSSTQSASTAASGGSTAVATPVVAAGAATVTVTAAPVKEVTTVTIKAPAPAPAAPVAPAAPATSETPKAAVTVPGDGTYEVGVDIKPGTYVSDRPDSGNCYWARRKAGEGLDSYIANNNSAGRSIVTIKASDKFFETSGCNDWTRR